MQKTILHSPTLESVLMVEKVIEKYSEIVISRREDMFRFQKEINFSKGIFLNPKRKNSIWKKNLEKRQLLNHVLTSYQN